MDSRLLLMDIKTGEFLAVMDANWITAMRTGAVAVHSILLLAKEGFSKIGMIGLGNTAGAALLVLAELMPEREFHIKLLRYKGQEDIFTERFAKYQNIHFTYEQNVEELVGESEVIISAATYLQQNICRDEYFQEGVLTVPIHTRGFQNCDLFFDRIYADDRQHVSKFDYFEKFRCFAEISDVVNGKAQGRQNSRERILAYNIGLSIHDIDFAARIYQMLEDDGTLLDIDMKEPQGRFWI